MQHILSIAGSDSCAGAGMQADLKTTAALGAYGLTVLTALTAQNTQGVLAIQEMEPWFIKAQLDAIFADIRVDAVKIGMLGSSGTIHAVAEYFAGMSLPLILDPVMIAKSGDRLLEESAIVLLKQELLPMVTVLTPNLPESEALVGFEIRDYEDMERACRSLLELGPDWVVVKGGHLSGKPVDVVGNGDDVYFLEGRRIEGNHNHGTGCTFASAIATYIGMGYEVMEAIRQAKDYVEEALQGGFPIGQGVGVLNHFAGLRKT